MRKERSISAQNSRETDLSMPSHNNKTIVFLKQFLLFSASGIAVTLLLISIGIWRSGNRLLATVESFLNPTAATPQIEVPTVVLEQIKATSELTTASFVMEAVVPASQERKIGDLVLANTRLLYVARGEVKAGVDLSKISAADLKITDKKAIEIRLPPPQIFDRKIDVDRSFVYDYDRGFLNLGPDAALDLQTLAQRKTLRKIVTSACQKGLLTSANEKAKLTVSSLLNAAGFIKVKVITSPPNKSSCR